MLFLKIGTLCHVFWLSFGEHFQRDMFTELIQRKNYHYLFQEKKKTRLLQWPLGSFLCPPNAPLLRIETKILVFAI
jgi:hypothetical protein